MSIITSLLDQDAYKLSMLQIFLHKFSDSWGRYEFKCRNKGIVWTKEMISEIVSEVDHLCTLRYTDEELDFLRTIRYYKKGFIEFLRIFQFNRDHIKIRLDGDELRITAEGPVFMVSGFEIFILSIVNEVYFKHTVTNVRSNDELIALYDNGRERLIEKILTVSREGFAFSDFGTRRRFNKAWHDTVVGTCAKALPSQNFVGTSNLYLAKKYNITPIGTMAHEFIQLGQSLDSVTLAESQKYMLQAWVDEYRGDLGYALSDTLGFDKFLKDFDLYFAKLYDGVRHDSGNPFEWARRMIEYYKSLKIDPRTKQLIFSDGLDFNLASELYREFKTQAKISFGIGTNFTNDFEGIAPLQIVMKLVEANNRPVAKLSDNPAKTMCEDTAFMSYLRQVLTY